MKKFYYSFFLLLTSYLLPLTSALAQAFPQGINYQAVARDNFGNPLAAPTVTVSFTIHQSAITGPTSFSETQTLTTNQFGLFTCVIGATNLPNLDSIAWGKHKYFLEVKVNNISMGTTQFMSVPYAFHAQTADSVKNFPPGGPGSGFSNMAVFNSSAIWPIPAGVTKIMVEVWGGGGGGGNYVAAIGGGGGGGYGKNILTVIPSTNYTVTVGAGGAA